MKASQQNVDPVTFGILWERLVATMEEQVTALMRTSFSPVVRENGDLASGLFDLRGRMICQPLTGTPGHINPLSQAVKNIFAEIPPSDLVPGDVIITNDPWLTTGQLLDVTVGVPIFADDRLVGFVACTCHMVDIGGYGPGTGGADVYEEGFQIPIMRLRTKGQEDATLMKLFRQNIRDADHFIGDLRAMAASCMVAGRRVLTLLSEYGLNSLDEVADEIIERSERAQRKAIEAIPDGVYDGCVDIDGFEEPIHLQCRLTISGSDITLDFAGSSSESRHGINVVLNYTSGYATYAIRSAIAPDIPNNDGSLAPIHVIAPERTIVNCKRPAPTTGRHLVGMFVAWPVWAALTQAVPGKIPAEGAGAVWTLQLRRSVAGMDDAQDTLMFMVSGGMGARPVKDGLSAVSFPSNIAEAPIEVWETILPVLIHRKELRVDSGGVGRYRGGLGQRIEIGLRDPGPWLANFMVDRMRFAAVGYHGGGEGALGKLETADGQVLPGKGRIVLRENDRIIMELPGGGGYGDPFDREPSRVADDVRNGLVSSLSAADQYAVRLTSDGEVDVEGTASLRDRHRSSTSTN